MWNTAYTSIHWFDQIQRFKRGGHPGHNHIASAQRHVKMFDTFRDLSMGLLLLMM